jgi:release factor glutamine methyltransferase
MTFSLSSDSLSTVVAQLQTAGCVFAEDEARLLAAAARSATELDSMVERRAAGLPLEHLLGWAEFRGLRIAVDAEVFVPRRRTGFLVEQAIALAGSRPVVVLDLCCGSGAVGAALAAELGEVELYAADIEPAAVRCTRRNLAAVAGAEVYEGDLYEPLPATLRGRVDILTANVPYVPTEAIELMPPEAREYEPKIALDGGPDGFRVLRRVAAGAPHWLAPGGHLLVETSQRQASRAADVFASNGLVPQVARSEELYSTVVIGQKTPM